MNFICTALRKFSSVGTLVVIVFGLMAMRGQLAAAQNIDVNGGVLTYTVTETTRDCYNSIGEKTLPYPYYDFYPITLTVGGVAYPLGAAAYWQAIPNCKLAGSPASDTFTYSPPGEVCTINFVPGAGYGSASATGSCSPAYVGYVNPKYVVVGVTYAPPGASSTVSYTGTTSVGSTTNISQSFQSDVGYSVSVAGSVGAAIPAGQATCSTLTPGCVKLTFTESTDYTQGSNSSKTNTISKATSVTYVTKGTPTQAPVNSDYDFIWIWLNPELYTTYVPSAGSNPASLQFSGYLMDPNDPITGQPPASGPYVAGPDIQEVQVGCLNGDIACPSTLTWANGAQGPGSYINGPTNAPLTRSWASAANGYQWPSGEMPALTFDDVCAILTFDPLAHTPSQCPVQNDYTLLNSLPAGTTTDGRFTKEGSPPNPIYYSVGAPTEMYSNTQTDTESVATGASNGVKQAFSVQESFGTNWFGIFSSTTTMTQSLTLTWNYSWLNTLTTTTSLTNALSITGPPDPPPVYPAGEPIEFLGYQDNIFGTFIFAPVDYCPGSSSPWCTE